jgi:hypothetical protein
MLSKEFLEMSVADYNPDDAETSYFVYAKPWLREKYFYHSAYPNLRFYGFCDDAAQKVVKLIIYLINVAALSHESELARLIHDALSRHSYIYVNLKRQTPKGSWAQAEKSIALAHCLLQSTCQELFNVFIFELCNAVNYLLPYHYLQDYEDSYDFAAQNEIFENQSSIRAGIVLRELGIKTGRCELISDLEVIKDARLDIRGGKLSEKSNEIFSHFHIYELAHNKYLIKKKKNELWWYNLQMTLLVCARRNTDSMMSRSDKLVSSLQAATKRNQELTDGERCAFPLFTRALGLRK